MANVTVSLPDDVVARLKAKLAPHGYTAEEFASSSLAGFADAGELIPQALEAELLQALDAPLLNADQVDWTAKAKRLEQSQK